MVNRRLQNLLWVALFCLPIIGAGCQAGSSAPPLIEAEGYVYGASATVKLSKGGEILATTQTSESGRFAFTIASLGDYVATPTSPDYVFSPEARQVSVTTFSPSSLTISSTKAVKIGDFFARKPASAGLAVVTTSAGSLSGVIVRLLKNGVSVAQGSLNDQGKVNFANLAAGAYTVVLIGSDGKELGRKDVTAVSNSTTTAEITLSTSTPTPTPTPTATPTPSPSPTPTATPTPTPTAAPGAGGLSILSTSPSNNATAIARNTAITVKLSKPISAQGISKSRILLSPMSQWFTNWDKESEVSITYNGLLAASTKYIVSIAGGVDGIQSTDGSTMTQDYSFSFTTSDFANIPADGKLTDAANDVSPGFVDITGATIEITDTLIRATIKLRSLPETLTFNHANALSDHPDYEWNVLFDTNNDNDADYMLATNHYKRTGSAPTTGEVLSNISSEMDKRAGSALWSGISTAVSKSRTSDSLVFEIQKSAHADLINITSASRVSISTSHDDGTFYSDSL